MSGNGGGGGGYGPPTGAPYGPRYGPPPGQGAPGPGPIPPQGYPYGPPPPVPPGPYAPPEPPPLLPPVEPSRAQKILRGVRNPFYAAQRAFRPSRADLAEDASVRRLQLWRTGLGLAAYIGLTATYRAVADVEGVKAMADDRFNQSWSSVLVLVCTFPLVVGAFIAAARGDLRRTYLRRALRPLGAVAAVIGSMATFPLAMAPETAGFRDAVGVVGTVVLAVLCLWSLGFALYGIGLSLVHVFRTADIHEVLPPLLAGILVWEMALLDVVTGAYSEVPPAARAAFVLGAPITVTALSWWELRRLKEHHGLTLREALGRS
ncbi:hypothetical protein ACWCYY_18890 [Kitasatospora sp. NPDC001664]